MAYDPTEWTTRSSPYQAWFGVAWSPQLQLFAAVAFDGVNRVMTSPNGITWTSRSTPNTNVFRDVVWSQELEIFVAVSSTGTNQVITSPDGVNWTERPTPSRSWRSVAWSPSLGLFAATSNNGSGTRVMTSPDGETWTIRSSAANKAWVGIEWSESLGIFAAVSQTTSTSSVMTSSDGVTWVSQTTPSAGYRDITWSASLGLFVAVGSDQVVTSSNGTTWTGYSAPSSGLTWGAVTWSEYVGYFAALSTTDSTSGVMTSADGVNWTQHSCSATQWRSICDAPNIFVGVGSSSTGQPLVITSGEYAYEGAYWGGLLSIMPPSAPDTPTLVLWNVLNSDITITLEAPSGSTPTRYECEYGNSTGVYTSGVVQSNIPNDVENPIVFSVTYEFDFQWVYFRIRAVNALGTSDWSIERSGFNAAD